MRSDAHISVVSAKVRGGTLDRHVARKLEGGRAYGIASGIGLPRTWGLSTVAALDGYERGLAESKDREPAERLRVAVGSARAGLAQTCDSLIERLLPDSTLVALILADGQLHVMSVGAGRVYIQRGGKPQRLTAREEQNGGLLRSRPSICSTPLEPGDLVLAGSVTAFSMASIAKAVNVLAEDPRTLPAVLASLLTDPAAKAGAGAAAVVIRVG